MHSKNHNSPLELLIVDDEPFVRDLLSRWLRDAGYSCATASSPAMALPQSYGVLRSACLKVAYPSVKTGNRAIGV
jgi:PleD family two-component response regulator